MTIQDMVDLLRVHDAVEDLGEIANKLVGSLDYGFGYDDGIIGRLDYINGIIRRNSPIYDDFEDNETQRFGQVLNDRKMTYEERARILLDLEDKEEPAPPRRKTKYNLLGEYLYRSEQDEVTLTFDQIKDILGFELPSSAYKYDAWWRDPKSHPQARALNDYGYKAGIINIVSHIAQFKRIGESNESSLSKAIESKAKAKVNAKADSLMPIKAGVDTIKVCGYDFTYVQDIELERDSNGKVVEYAPQSKYQNTKGKRLHNYGSGTFCRFRIDAGQWPGVYLWVVDDEIIYIGETVKLGQRFNTGYGEIAGVNCYEGGQKTNCKMNKVVLELSKIGKTVKLYFFNTTDYKRVELELLGAINTQYNVKDNT